MVIVKCPVCGKEKETNSMMPIDCDDCIMVNTKHGMEFVNKKDLSKVKMTRLNKEENK